MKSAQVRAKKLLDGQSNGEIDEAILPEGQRFKEKHLEDPLQQLDAQPYEYQVRDIGIPVLIYLYLLESEWNDSIGMYFIYEGHIPVIVFLSVLLTGERKWI